MNKFGSILFQLQKTNSIFKLTPSRLRYLSTAETPTSTPVNQNEVDKNIEQKQDNIQQTEEESIKPGGFAEAFKKYSAPEEPELDRQVPFPTLLRNSKLMHLGDPEGKVVVGKIFQVVHNDLYIDFGWKFHCVCTKPMKNSNDYVRGAKVRLRIKELELSTRFLGATKDITLMEADCTLLGLISTPNRIPNTSTPPEEPVNASTAAQ